MSEPTAAAADCEHSFETRIRGGEPLSVRICVFCRLPNWTDLREQLDVLYGGNEAALTRVFGGGRTAHVIAHNLNAHGHAIQRVRYMTDEQLLAVPGIGETSLAWIRNAFPSLEPCPSSAEQAVEATSATPDRTQEHSMTDCADQVVQRPPTRLYEVRTAHGGIYRAEGDVIESGEGWFTLWASEFALALRVPETDVQCVRQVQEGELEAEAESPHVDYGELTEAVRRALGITPVDGQVDIERWLLTACRELEKSEAARAHLRDERADARTWARHGYEIGQKHCSWSDHGVAPEWLTEGWPPHIDSCEHLKQAAELDEAVARVRATPTEPELMNADQERPDVWLHGYGIGVRAAKAALHPRLSEEASES